jgi:hypothetical protein
MPARILFVATGLLHCKAIAAAQCYDSLEA